MSLETLGSDAWLAAVKSSHEKLAQNVAPLTDAQVAGPSYDTDWSIAQVLSHLGSGAEIFTLLLQAGLAGEPAPGIEAFKPVWDRWNAKTPHEQAHDGLRSDAAFLEQVEVLSEDQRRAWSLQFFGGDQALNDLLRLRLSEHALHTWDVAVMGDANATLAPDAVGLLIDTIDQLVSRTAKPPTNPLALHVTTDNPTRRFVLNTTGEKAELQAVDPAGSTAREPFLRLPAEALIRLVYGRLDPEHTPPLEATGIDLEVLRQVFPGV